jgi:O-antigen ligase
MLSPSPLTQDPSSGRSRFDWCIFSLLVMFLLCSAFSIALSEIGYFSALVLWLAKSIALKKFPSPRTPLDRFFLAYAAAEMLATMFAHDKLYSLLYLQRRLLLLPIAYILLGNLNTLKDVKILFGAMIISAFAVSLLGLQDFFLNFSEYWHFQRRLSEFQMYMTAGGIMMVIVLMLLPFVIHPKTPRKVRILFSLAIVPMLVNLMFTFTRSSWLGFIAGAVIIGLFRSKKLLIPLVVIIVAIVLLAPPEIKGRIYSIVDPHHPSNAPRVHMWETGLKIFRDYPVFGIGDVGVETVWDRYSDPAWAPEGHLHNNLIMWLATIGIVGFSALVALFVKLWMVVRRIAKRHAGDWFVSSIALGGLAMMAGFHINGLFEWNFGDAEIITLVWAIVGLILASEKALLSESR